MFIKAITSSALIWPKEQRYIGISEQSVLLVAKTIWAWFLMLQYIEIYCIDRCLTHGYSVYLPEDRRCKIEREFSVLNQRGGSREAFKDSVQENGWALAFTHLGAVLFCQI